MTAFYNNSGRRKIIKILIWEKEVGICRKLVYTRLHNSEGSFGRKMKKIGKKGIVVLIAAAVYILALAAATLLIDGRHSLQRNFVT